MSDARLYGRAMGHGSHAQVTRGFEAALNEAGLLAGLVGLDVLGLNDHDTEPWNKSGGSSALAKHGVFTGPLDMLNQMLRAKHERRWVMVAPNSNWMPERFIKGLEQVATDILVPSPWAASMVMPLLRGAAVQVVPHGVHAGFERNAAQYDQVVSDYDAGQFRVLHCSTSERQRKGTWELLQAWKLLKRQKELPELAELILVLDYAVLLRLSERMLDAELNPPNVKVMLRIDATPRAMADVLRRVHVVCQPSRAEAFGLLPLEALACGTPVVVTTCTGHSYLRDYFPPPRRFPLVVVNHEGLAPIDDGPGALAPAVKPESIARSLRVAFEQWNTISAEAFDEAPQVGVDWSWSRQLGPWLEQIRETR